MHSINNLIIFIYLFILTWNSSKQELWPFWLTKQSPKIQGDLFVFFQMKIHLKNRPKTTTTKNQKAKDKETFENVPF